MPTPKIEIYTQWGCPFCYRSKALLDAKGVTYTEIDVTMDTAPYNWLTTWLPVGANGDSPASPLSYVTVDQIASMSGPITVSFSYLPLES